MSPIDKFKADGKRYRFTKEEAQGNPLLKMYTCPICSIEFGLYYKKLKNPCCSSKCRATRKKYAEINRKGKGFFFNHKHEYANKIIQYTESPSRFGYIGVAKTPLMPVKEGHGFYGVLMQDQNRYVIQCHSCGEWKRRITNSHLKKCCGLDSVEYKKKYSLNATSGLVSDDLSLKLTKNALKNKIGQKFFTDNARELAVKSRISQTGENHTLEFFNKHGTCPEQLKQRLYDFIRCNRELPAGGNRGRSIYKALRMRYGSWGHALQSLGLPYFKRTGTNMLYVFPDGTKYKYNINQFNDREKLYHLLMEKCPVLS